MIRRRWLPAALAAAVAAVTVVFSESRDRPRDAGHQAQYVRAGALRLRAVRATGAGPTVILLHGFGESLMSWRSVLDGLAGKADVVALDLPGFGLSDKPASGYATDSLAATVVRAMDELGVERAVLVGHSMGGAVAIATSIAAPGRISALVLVAPAVSAGAWGVKPPGDSGGTSDWLRTALTRYEALRPRFTAPHDPDWLAESPQAMAYSPATDSAYPHALGAVLREFDFDYLTLERAERLQPPILLIWGEFDQVIPVAVGRTMDSALSRATLAVIHRSLHRPHVERPTETTALIASFLDSLGQVKAR